MSARQQRQLEVEPKTADSRNCLLPPLHFSLEKCLAGQCSCSKKVQTHHGILVEFAKNKMVSAFLLSQMEDGKSVVDPLPILSKLRRHEAAMEYFFSLCGETEETDEEWLGKKINKNKNKRGTFFTLPFKKNQDEPWTRFFVTPLCGCNIEIFRFDDCQNSFSAVLNGEGITCEGIFIEKNRKVSLVSNTTYTLSFKSSCRHSCPLYLEATSPTTGAVLGESFLNIQRLCCCRQRQVEEAPPQVEEAPPQRERKRRRSHLLE